MSEKHSFTVWNWEQEAKELFFLTDDGKYRAYVPNYHLFKNKVFGNAKKFGMFPMKKYKITIEAVQ